MKIQSFTYLKRACIPIDPDLLTPAAINLLLMMDNRLSGRYLIIEPVDDLAGREIPVESTISHTERVIRYGFHYFRRTLSQEEVASIINEGRGRPTEDPVCYWMARRLATMETTYKMLPRGSADRLESWSMIQSLAHDIRVRVISEQRRSNLTLIKKCEDERIGFGDIIDRAYRRYTVAIPGDRANMTEAEGANWLNRSAVAFAEWCRQGCFRPTPRTLSRTLDRLTEEDQ